MKPLLKWAGGKARLARDIHRAFGGPCTGTYHEPFAGSAAVFLYRRSLGAIRGPAILSDLNGKLMATHRAVRDEVDAVLAELARLPAEDWRERYYDVREAYNTGPWEGPAHAARFLWLNRAGFNGLYRENRSGRFNVPVGRYKSVALPSHERFREVSAMLQGVELVTCGFDEALRRATNGDQVYCDPPYVPLSGTAKFTAYCSAPFGHDQQLALAHSARTAAARGSKVVLSNHDLPVVRDDLYPLADGFRHVARAKVSRAISRKASSRSARVTELVTRIGPLPPDSEAA